MRAIVIHGPKAPFGVQCLHCRRTAKDGEVCLVHTVHGWGYILFHKDCMAEILSEAPLDNFENLQQRALEGTLLE
jgi:hypothetical protein